MNKKTIGNKILFLGVVFATIFYLYKNYYKLIDSNFFVGVVTLAVGGIAIYLYLKQKNDFKKEKASIILMEIRHAEKMIEQIKSGNIIINQVDTKLLPTNNWGKNNYLFINDLDRDELDLVNNFFNQCEIIDKYLLQISINRQLEQKHNAMHKALVDMASDESKALVALGIDQAQLDENSLMSYNKRRNIFIKITGKESASFIPDAAKNAIDKALKSTTSVTTSSAGGKLKRIAKLK